MVGTLCAAWPTCRDGKLRLLGLCVKRILCVVQTPRISSRANEYVMCFRSCAQCCIRVNGLHRKWQSHPIIHSDLLLRASTSINCLNKCARQLCCHYSANYQIYSLVLLVFHHSLTHSFNGSVRSPSRSKKRRSSWRRLLKQKVRFFCHSLGDFLCLAETFQSIFYPGVNKAKSVAVARSHRSSLFFWTRGPWVPRWVQVRVRHGYGLGWV